MLATLDEQYNGFPTEEHLSLLMDNIGFLFNPPSCCWVISID